MRTNIIKTYKVVHTWTGVLAGMLLFIAFYAGAITVFQPSLERWATPPVSDNTPAAVPLRETQELIIRTLDSHPEAARSFQIDLSPHPPHRLQWEVKERGADDHDEGRYFAARRNENGDIFPEEITGSKLAEFINGRHRVVGLPVDNALTRIVTGIVAVLFFLALISGLVVLSPKLMSDFFALRLGASVRRMLRDAHVAVGIGSFPFLLIIALTTTVFAFHDIIYLVQNSLIHDSQLAALFRGDPGEGQSGPYDPAKMLPPEAIVARVNAISPRFEPTSLQYMRVTGPSPTVRVAGHDPQGMSYRTIGGFAMVDPYSGKVETTEYLPGHQSPAATVLTGLFTLHFATFGGTLVDGLYFLLALLGAWLFYSGNLHWIEARRRRTKKGGENQPPVQRKGAILMASTTVGVCLGAVCGISTTVAAEKWIHALGADPHHWHHAIYYTVFFAALGWAHLRGAPRAAVTLLRYAAASTLAIPLTTWVAAAMPSFGIWANSSPESIGVDVAALVMAFAFGWMSRRTAKRILHGPLDSVWSK